MNQGIMAFFQAVSFLTTTISLIVPLAAICLVFADRRSSGHRSILVAGIFLELVSSVSSLALQMMPFLNQQQNDGGLLLLGYAACHLMSVVGLGLILWGGVRLLRRNSELEMLLEEQNDD